MIKSIISGFLILLLGFQHPCQIKKVWLFSKTQYAGNIPKPVPGRPVKNHTQKLIAYLEISKNDESPEWQSAYFNGERHSVKVLAISEDSVKIGTVKNTKTPIVLKAKSGNKLVKLEFTAGETISITNPIKFELDGLLNKQQVHYQSNEPVIELSPDLMP